MRDIRAAFVCQPWWKTALDFAAALAILTLPIIAASFVQIVGG